MCWLERMDLPLELSATVQDLAPIGLPHLGLTLRTRVTLASAAQFRSNAVTHHRPLIWSFYMACIRIKFFFVALTIGLFASGLLAQVATVESSNGLLLT